MGVYPLSDQKHDNARLAGDHIVPFSRSDAKTWLDNLPVSDGLRAAAEIRSMLSTMNTVDMPPRRRLEVLEAFRATLSNISYRLTDRRTGSQLPLSVSSRTEVALLSQIHRLLAMGYSWAAVSFALAGTRYDKPSHAMSIHRAILYFSAVCCDAYRIYNPVPRGVWLAMHELVKKAQQHSLLKFPVTDQLNAFKPQTTITHVYKQILLTAALDPYKFAHGEIDEMHDRCNQLAVHAVLVTPPFVPAGKCQFVIDLDDDKPARAVRTQDNIDDPVKYLVLDTTQLVIALYDQFQNLDQRLTHGGQQEVKPEDRDRRQLLDFLISAWGGKMTRKSMRLTISDNRLLIHGFDGVTYFLNGRSELRPSNRTESDIRNGVFRKERLRADHGPADLGEWSCVDESAHGVQLTKESTQPVVNLIGRLIAVRRPTDKQEAWDVGVVRWMRNEQSNKITVGVYKFGPVASAVSIRGALTESNEPADQSSSPAVLVKTPEDGGIKYSLIVPKDVSKVRHRFLIDGADENLLIRTTRVRLSTNELDWFEIEIVQDLADQAAGADSGMRQQGVA